MSWMKSTYQAYYGHEDINADAVTTGKFKYLVVSVVEENLQVWEFSIVLDKF
jgi:hypothetical protein